MASEIFIQAGYYFVVMVLTLLLMGGLLQKGFFWNFFRVKISFGKYILIKIRTVNRDYFRIGRIEDSFLVFKSFDGTKRISLKDNSAFYRSIGVLWIDIDEETNAISKTDYTAMPGFDSVKYNNLFVRTLYRPSATDKNEKIILGAIMLCVALVVIVGFLVYQNGYTLEFIRKQTVDIVDLSRRTVENIIQ